MVTYTLDQVVRAANAEMGYKTLHRYLLFLHFAFDAFYKLRRDNVIKTVKFIQLNMVSKRVALPANVLAVGKVGLQIGRRVLPCIPDASISIDPANIVGVSPIISDTGVAVFDTSVFDFMNGNAFLALEASLNPSTPRYKVDYNKSEIVFDRGNDGTKIYLEVVESGFVPGMGTVVPHEALLPMKSYISFRSARFKLGAAAAETVAAEKEYLDEFDESLAAMSDLSGAAILSTIFSKNSKYY